MKILKEKILKEEYSFNNIIGEKILNLHYDEIKKTLRIVTTGEMLSIRCEKNNILVI